MTLNSTVPNQAFIESHYFFSTSQKPHIKQNKTNYRVQKQKIIGLNKNNLMVKLY